MDTREIRGGQILAAVASAYGVTVAALQSPRREKRFVWPRHVACYLCREFTSLSTSQIGRILGGRDHTTVMHAVKRVQDAKTYGDEPVQLEIEQMELLVRSIKPMTVNGWRRDQEAEVRAW